MLVALLHWLKLRMKQSGHQVAAGVEEWGWTNFSEHPLNYGSATEHGWEITLRVYCYW